MLAVLYVYCIFCVCLQGYSDPEYRKRRAFISELAFRYKQWVRRLIKLFMKLRVSSRHPLMKKNLLFVTEATRCPPWSTRRRKCPHGEDESCTSWSQIGGRLKCTDVVMMLCLKEGGVPAAEEHLLQSGLQAVHGRSAAAGEGVRLRRGPHPSAQRGLRLPERWRELNNWNKQMLLWAENRLSSTVWEIWDTKKSFLNEKKVNLQKTFAFKT